MKFVSKSGNLCITLKPGIPASAITGTPNDPGLHIRFDNGMVTINEEKTIQMMKNHIGFNTDFFEVNESTADPFESMRKDKEPAHVITEMNYGQPTKSYGSKQKADLSPEIKKMITEMARSMAVEMSKELVPKAAMEMVRTILAKGEENKGTKTVESTGDKSEE